MPRIRFERDGQTLAVIDAEAGELLLDVARRNDVALHWRCGQGTCGTCRVRVHHAGQPATQRVQRKERNVLLRAGVIAADAAAQETWPDEASVWRLACYLSVGENDWTVCLPAA
ncbi:2Fe-2S iron-sulfur cluster-binding protein [Paludibacterium yongneupense]|uniref:2Fe-2S iron-sulfur cluster-binding protein n=1 Tax=Paludibacterium yongneupense TaxID=400061 RepID=UPI0003F6E01C|nr:2Fe-2S iron-sulfur cluster-binding protein [Paludibacterium yongneupense]